MATNTGLRAVDLDLSVATVSFATLNHDLAVATVVAELESGDVEHEVVTEREMRAEHRVPDGRRYAPSVREPGRSRTGHTGPISPSITATTAGSLSRLSCPREDRCANHGDPGRLPPRNPSERLVGVLYLAPTPQDVERLKKLATCAGLGPRRDQGERGSFLDELRNDVWFLAGCVDAIDGLAECLAGYNAQHVDAVAERERRRGERLARDRIEREQQQADNAARLANRL